MATPRKSKSPRRPRPAAKEVMSDAASPAIVSAAAAALRVVPPPVAPDPEVAERAARDPLASVKRAPPIAGIGGIC